METTDHGHACPSCAYAITYADDDRAATPYMLALPAGAVTGELETGWNKCDSCGETVTESYPVTSLDTDTEHALTAAR